MKRRREVRCVPHMAPEKGHEPKEGPELGISSRDRPSLHLGNLVGVEGDALGSDKVAQVC